MPVHTVHRSDRAAARPALARARAHARPHRTLGMARTPQGVVVVPKVVNGVGVSQAELAQALVALAKLPASDLQLLVSHGIQIELYPVAGLEDGLLGATTIIQDESGGRWEPTRVRIAVRSGYLGAQAIGEIVQHEVGHCISVFRRQDRSEDAAIAYARRY